MLPSEATEDINSFMFTSDEVEATNGGKYEKHGNEVEEDQDTSLKM